MQLVGMGLLTRLGFEAFRCLTSMSTEESRMRLHRGRKFCGLPVTHSIWGCVELLVSSDRAEVPELPGGVYVGSGGEPGMGGQWRPSQLAGCGPCIIWLNTPEVTFLQRRKLRPGGGLSEGLQEAETCLICKPVSDQASSPYRYARFSTQLSLLPRGW